MRIATGIWLRTALVAAVCLAAAQAKPNFTGNWKMNVGKSDFGAMPTPDVRTDKIVHNDPALTDAVHQSTQVGEVDAEFHYSTDGKETTNSVRGNEIKSVAKWEGNELVIAAKSSIQGGEVTINDRWSLSTDGKTLTILRHVNSAMGETDLRIVLEKQ